MLLYLFGVAGEILVLTSIYLVMPVGRPSWRHALVGGITATVLWEITRHVLVWYFGTLSQVTVVYGSLTTAIVVLLSLEIAATLLLLGAQVIAEYERIGTTAHGARRRGRYGRNLERDRAPPAQRSDQAILLPHAAMASERPLA